MTQQTKAINLTKFEAGDRPTDQDFADLFDSILFQNETNGLAGNDTTLLGNFTIGGNLALLGGGNILMSGSFSSGDPSAGVSNGNISSFTNTSTPPYFASSSAATVIFNGVSGGTTSSIQLSSDNDENSFVKFGIENGKGFLDAQDTTVISYSTGSSATTGGDNIIHMSASVGIGTSSPSNKLEVDGGNQADHGYFHGSLAGSQGIKVQRDSGDFTQLQANYSGFGGGLNSSDALRFSTNNAGLSSPAMYIETNNNVGIGTTGPGEKLHIEGTTAATRVKVKTTTGNAIFRVESSVSDFSLIGRGDSNAFDIYNANQAKTPFKIIGGSDENNTLVITGGKVGIGTDNPISPLHVKGNTRLEPDDGNNNFITFTSQTSTQANQHYYVNNNTTWNVYSGAENYHIRRASANPGTPNSKIFVTFHAGEDTGGHTEGVEFQVPVTASFFKGDGSALTNITSGQIALFGGDLSEHNLTTINSAGDGLDGEANLNFDGNQLRIGPESANAGVDVHINHNATSDVILLLESDGSGNDSTVALRQEGTWPSNATGVDLVYDGGVDKFYIKGYTAGGGFIGNSVSIKPETPTDTLVLDANGKVGIGIDTPTEKLHVEDGVILANKKYFEATPILFASNQDSWALKLGASNNAGFDDFGIKFKSTAGGSPYLSFRTNANDDVLVMMNGGNVGIGTNDPASKLSVAGNIAVRDAADSANVILFSNANNVGAEPDILFNASGLIATQNAIHLNINSDGGSDDLFIRSGGDTNAATEIMRVTSDGKLGLGGVDPSNKGIHVYKNNNDTMGNNDNVGQLLLENDGASGDVGMVYLLTGAERWKTFLDHSNDDAFTIRNTTNTSSYLTMKYVSSAHRIGIFDTTPSYPLDVSGEARFQDQLRMEEGNKIVWSDNTDSGFIRFNSTSDAASDFEIGTTDNGTEHIRFTLSGTEKARINGAGIQVEETVTSPDSSHTLITNSGGGYIEVKSNNSTYGLIVRDYNSSNHINIDANSGYGTIGYNTTDGPLYISDDDRLGIGINNPSYILHAVEDSQDTIAKFTSTFDNGYVRIRQTVDTTGAAGILTENSSGIKGFVGYYDDRMRLVADSGPNSTKGILVDSNGNIEIEGTLNIDGTAHSIYMADYDDGTVNTRLICRDNALEVFEGGFIVGNYNNDVFSGDSAITEKVMHTGQIRIGTPADDNYRRIFMSSDRMFFQQMSGTSWDATAPYIENGDAEGQISTFTGQHRNKPSSNISNYVDKTGYIVVSSGVYSNIPENRTKEEIEVNNTEVLTTPQIDEALPIVELSTTANDKKVFGVIGGFDDPNSTDRDVVVQGGFNLQIINRVDNRLIINSLGEGAIMVSNINGNLENGDYITTSTIKGLGMKQDDDLLHNYTVAKITQDCDFTSGATEIRDNGVTYKTKLVGCTYHCG